MFLWPLWSPSPPEGVEHRDDLLPTQLKCGFLDAGRGQSFDLSP